MSGSRNQTWNYVPLYMPAFLRNIFLIIGLLLFTLKVFGQKNVKYSKEEVGFIRCFQGYLEVEFSDPNLAKKYADSCVFWARKTKDDAYLGQAFQCKGWYA